MQYISGLGGTVAAILHAPYGAVRRVISSYYTSPYNTVRHLELWMDMDHKTYHHTQNLRVRISHMDLGTQTGGSANIFSCAENLALIPSYH
uniref:Uncharacterized protein n=1 Tax=Romanomermis culicivorax TaxID=13658 RepID=A0A915HR84_ROMCU